MQVLLGRGRSPAYSADWGLDYLLARRQVTPGTRSLFLTVLDAFQKAPVVRSVRLISEAPLLLEVSRSEGVDEIHLNIPAGPSRTTAPRPLGVRVRSRTGDKWVRDVQIGNWEPGKGPGYATGTVKALDYGSNQIVIETAPDRQADFTPGCAVRIYNQGRSATFRVREARREGGRFRITLDQTALLARGPVTEVDEGTVTLSAYLVFANGQAEEKGKLKPGLDYFSGSWLGEGKIARRLSGAVQGENSKIYLEKSTPADQLRRDYAGRIVSIWQYGVGDSVECVRVRNVDGVRKRTSTGG